MDNQETRFKEIYETNYPKVIRLCLGYVNGNQEQALDLAQEIFIRAWENLDGFRQESHISTWIYRIAVNTCLGQLRKSKKATRNYRIEDIGETAEAISTESKEEMLTDLYACINKLSKTNKAIIMLELEGIPQKEIAEIMGLKHEAIRTRIHRIKNELIKCTNNG